MIKNVRARFYIIGGENDLVKRWDDPESSDSKNDEELRERCKVLVQDITRDENGEDGKHSHRLYKFRRNGIQQISSGDGVAETIHRPFVNGLEIADLVEHHDLPEGFHGLEAE